MASATAAPIPNMGQLPHSDSAPQTSSPTNSSLGEPLVCQWQGCTAPNHPSAEALYEHVCEQHIGRKSTNNLNLQCFWGSCRTTTVKRDHITSHIRVHVPLKPHKCDFCGKSFKRPQDLKKHVKTHADESVLFNSPQNNATNPQQAPNGYQASTNGKNGGYDVQHNQHLNYPYAGNHGPYGSNNAIPTANFAYLSGYNNQSSYAGGGVGLTESRKRTHDALNDFFGDVKRRNIDGGQYQDLGARFSQFLNWFAPMSAAGTYGATNAFNPGSYNTGVYDNGGLGYQPQHAPPMGAYTANAFPELRTKGDLLTIDQFLEQLQHTVFENPHEGVGVTPYQPAGFGRPDGSPRQFGVPHVASTPSASSDTYTNSTNGDAQSMYAEPFPGHSPKPSLQDMSPRTRLADLSPYPTLPSVNTFDPSMNQFNAMLPGGLGPQYDYTDSRRRGSGGHLQRANPATESQEDRALREKLERGIEASEEGKDTKMEEGNIKLPGVSEITRVAEQGEGEVSEEAKPEIKEDARTINVKTIKALREYIARRLDKGDFAREGSEAREDEQEDGNRTPRAQQDTEMKDDSGSPEAQGQTTPKREGATSLYPELPSLRPVEA